MTTDSPADKGFTYERNVARYLANKQLAIRSNAGAKSDRPDIYLKQNGMTAGCEIKIHGKSSGSLRFKYDNGRWYFPENPDHALEKDVMRNLAQRYNIMAMVNERWHEPAKWNTALKLTPSQRLEKDSGSFHEINVNVAAWEMGHYYNAKNTWYINIGDAGFYLLSKRDPLQINTKLVNRQDALVPLFADSGRVVCNCRMQVKDRSRNNYGFIMAMRIHVPVLHRSPYNLGALLGDGPDLDYIRTNIKCLL